MLTCNMYWAAAWSIHRKRCVHLSSSIHSHPSHSSTQTSGDIRKIASVMLMMLMRMCVAARLGRTWPIDIVLPSSLRPQVEVSAEASYSVRQKLTICVLRRSLINSNSPHHLHANNKSTVTFLHQNYRQ